jgi:hypothetical protein
MAAGLTGLSVAAVWSAPSGADSSGSNFEAISAADGVRFTWSVPNFAPVDDIIDGGGPSAQARVDSLGVSTAFASAPFPGETFVSLPGLIAGFTGLPALPAYPFYVRSSHPSTPEQTFAQPGFTLLAKSDDHSSTGQAATGQSGDTSVSALSSTARSYREDSGALVAEATSRVELFKAGPLEIKGLTSTAKVVKPPSGDEQATSSLEAAQATVNGTPVGITGDGFVAGDTRTPIPGTQNPLLDALAQNGLSVEVVKAQRTEDGVVAPSLIVTSVYYSEQIQRPVTIRYQLGASSASVHVSGLPGSPVEELPAFPDGTVGGPSDSGSFPDTVPSTDSSGSAVLPAGATSTGGFNAGSSSTPSSGLETAAPAVPGGGQTAPTAAGAAQGSAGVVLAARASAEHWAFGSFYLVLFAAALVIAGGGELIRSLGVRGA